MVPMRSLPFRVICLVGMNDQDFPRSQHPASFDLIAAHPRLGDRNRRQDDRYLFLEAILSARDVLYCSWQGRNQRDDTLLPPSVLINELLDYIDKSCQLADAEASVEKISTYLTTTHPMQPFARHCFDGSTATASYNPAWLPATTRTAPPLFWHRVLSAPGPEWQRIDFADLIRFWRQPARFFLEQRLGLRLSPQVTRLAASEDFSFDALKHYQLRHDALNNRLGGRSQKQVQGMFAASGCLSPGALGQVQFDEIAERSEPFVAHLEGALANPLPPLEVDLHLGAFQLSGWLGDLYPTGRVVWRAGKCKGADLMALWLHHLLLNLLKPAGIPWVSRLLTQNEAKSAPNALPVWTVLAPLDDPASFLRPLLDDYQQGLSQPLAFFPETSLAWAKEVAKGQGKEEDAARKVWEDGYLYAGEGGKEANPYFFPSHFEPSDAFIELSELFVPLLAAILPDDETEAHHADT
jgi:exodeoxyribonuclease V gamma subunit